MLEDKLTELLEFARNTDLQEVVWEKNGAKIRFRRGPGKGPSRTADRVPAERGAGEPPASEPIYIRSAMVGTFFRGDTSDRPPLVVEGTLVASGQPVGSIEAMKIRKDVVSPMGCRIVKSLVADGHSVEYGQPLFEVEPANGNGHV